MSNLKKIEWYGLIRIFAACIVAFSIATVIIIIVEENDATVSLRNFFFGALSNRRNFSRVIEEMIPLVFTGLAINVMFRGGLFSLSADSAFYMGGVTAAAIAIAWPLPFGVHQTVIILAAAIVGSFFGLLPALIRKFTGAHEFVTSMMLSFITFNFGYWIIRRFFLDTANGVFSVRFLETATLGRMFERTNIHYGAVIMIAASIIMWIVMTKSRYGRALSIIGSNEHFARYAGVSVTSAILIAQLIGGVLAGTGGAVTMIGLFQTFQWMEPVTYVWDGILINLLSARKPHLIPFSAFFVSYIRVGANVMSRVSNISAELVEVIQAIIILLIVAERFMYFLKKRKEEREALAACGDSQQVPAPSGR